MCVEPAGLSGTGRLLILVALHSICFARAGLAIYEDGGIKPLCDTVNQSAYIGLLVYLALRGGLLEHMIKPERLVLRSAVTEHLDGVLGDIKFRRFPV